MTGLYVSIDFEDFAHDIKRDLGLWDTGPLRVDALWRSYEEIDRFYRAHGGAQGRKATFFCTGIIADQAPDLIARIATDGHEVACHYHFHDCLDLQDKATIEKMLGRAKTALEDAANAPVRGFRAPNFRISRKNADQYRLVAQHFDYDSSFPTGDLTELSAFRDMGGLGDFPILPIFAGHLFAGHLFAGRGPRLRLGGSYLKLFPLAPARNLIRQATARGFTPHIYLHPYEFTARGDYMLSKAELRPLGARRAFYWRLRQTQWHKAGNRSLTHKLRKLIPDTGLLGRLDAQLPAAQSSSI